MRNLNVIVSVDWEPDHGAWAFHGVLADYGGILKGTPAFCAMLDRLAVPCTWFIESSQDPKRDLPVCLADMVRRVVARGQDEVGLHIHWRRPVSGKSVLYETSDTAWCSAQIDHGVQRLNAVGARPRAFRSGALLSVRSLPQILRDRGFDVDSSTLWGYANRLGVDKRRLERKPLWTRLGMPLRQVLGGLPVPYFTDGSSVEQHGDSGILEFPIAYSLFDVKRLGRRAFFRYLAGRPSIAGRSNYLMLFFHIDELTKPGTGPDEKTQLDEAVVEHFQNHLSALKCSGARFLTCSEARKTWLEESVMGVRQQAVVERLS